MSVSLAGPDGQVMGGGPAGLLEAAGPVQVVVGSFLLGHHLEHKTKKQRVEHNRSTITSTPVNLITSEEIKVSFGGVKPIMTPAAFQEENITFNNVQDSRNSSADDKVHLPQKESNLNQSNAEAAC